MSEVGATESEGQEVNMELDGETFDGDGMRRQGAVDLQQLLLRTIALACCGTMALSCGTEEQDPVRSAYEELRRPRKSDPANHDASSLAGVSDSEVAEAVVGHDLKDLYGERLGTARRHRDDEPQDWPPLLRP